MQWEVLGHPNTDERGRGNTLPTSVMSKKTGWQATDERVNTIPLVSASEMVEQHPTFLPDIVDTIGQLAHSHTDSLERAATTAGIDTQSTGGWQATKIADPSLVFATGNIEECAQQLPNTVYTIGQQENTRTVAACSDTTVRVFSCCPMV